MPTDDGTPAVPEPTTEPTPPPEGEQTPEGAAQADAPDDEDERPITLREARKLRREAQSLRERLRAFEEQESEAEKAKLSEAERLAADREALKKEREALETERVTLVVSRAVLAAAPKMGLVDPDAAMQLMDWDQIEFDDKGPTNVDAVLKDLVAQKPYLVNRSSGPARGDTINAGNGVDRGPQPKLTADELEAARSGGMSPDRYAALKGVKTLNEWLATRKT